MIKVNDVTKVWKRKIDVVLMNFWPKRKYFVKLLLKLRLLLENASFSVETNSNRISYENVFDYIYKFYSWKLIKQVKAEKIN